MWKKRRSVVSIGRRGLMICMSVRCQHSALLTTVDNKQQRETQTWTKLCPCTWHVCCALGPKTQCPTAVHRNSFRTVQRSGQRSPLKHKRQHKEEANKTSSSPAAVQLTFSFVMDTAGLAHGPGFCRNVRGAFGVDVLEWYAVMSGIAAPLLNSCEVEVSQGVSGQPSTLFSPINLPPSKWI